MFDHIIDGLQHCSDKELQEMVQTGVIYTPNIPLQVSKIDMSMPQRAKTPEQKRAFIERLYAAWLAYPELRLGQLISNKIQSDDIILFYTEDQDLIEAIEHEANG